MGQEGQRGGSRRSSDQLQLYRNNDLSLDCQSVECSGRRELELVHLLEELPAVIPVRDVWIHLDIGHPALGVHPEAHRVFAAPHGTRTVCGDNDELWLWRENGATLAPGTRPHSGSHSCPASGPDATPRSGAGTGTASSPWAAPKPQRRHNLPGDFPQFDALSRGGELRQVRIGKLKLGGRSLDIGSLDGSSSFQRR